MAGGPTPGDDTPLGSDYEVWKKEIRDCNGAIDTLTDSERNIDLKITRIESFRTRYETDLESADLSTEEFDDIFMKAETLLERIEKF